MKLAVAILPLFVLPLYSVLNRTQETMKHCQFFFFSGCCSLIHVCVWHPCFKLLTPSLSCVVGSAANTKITLWCLLLSPRVWGTCNFCWLMFEELSAVSVAVISVSSVLLHSLCSRCPSQIPSWRLRSPSLLMPWAAILLLRKWILVEMPWEIWEQRCWQKPYR